MQDLKILQICVFGIDVELDPGHRYVEVDTIEDLAESRTALLSAGWQGALEENPAAGRPYPVPHCSTLVIFSCSRLLSHATNSCLQRFRRQIIEFPMNVDHALGRTLILPS